MVNHREYYKRENDDYLRIQVMMGLMSSWMYVIRLCTKNALTIH
jgi:hypothetical protein